LITFVAERRLAIGLVVALVNNPRTHGDKSWGADVAMSPTPVLLSLIEPVSSP
jgi:hypothetical protein